MKIKSLLILFSLGSFLFLGSGCTKIEGPGGAATIKGKVHVTEYDGAGNEINNYFAPKFDVFIIYGNEEGENFYDDDVETSFDGSFEFNFLEVGNYKIFVYEDCNTCFSGKSEQVIPVELTGKKEVFDVGTIEVYENF